LCGSFSTIEFREKFRKSALDLETGQRVAGSQSPLTLGGNKYILIPHYVLVLHGIILRIIKRSAVHMVGCIVVTKYIF
jgi:glucose dehydrogenase